MNHHLKLPIITLTLTLLCGLALATTPAEHPAASKAHPTPTAQLVREIRTQVQTITHEAPSYRKVELWQDTPATHGFRAEGAAAYFQGEELRKIVVVGPKCCTAGTDVHEWYFVRGQGVFMLQTQSWYKYTNHGILPQITSQYSLRYYLHAGHLVRTLPLAEEDGDERMDDPDLAREAKKLTQAVKKARRK